MKTRILTDVKILLGIDNSDKDNILNFIVEDTISGVLAYCRIESIEKIPCGLESVIVHMVVQSYRSNGYGESEPPREIKSISQGDREITFEDRKGFFNSYRERLKPYINRRAKVPSEV